jgi:subtilase family serine protease
MKIPLYFFAFIIVFSIIGFSQSDLLWYGSITIKPAAPSAGDIVTFTAVVRATAANSNAFVVKGGIDGTELFSKNCPALIKTTKNTVSVQWPATVGNHTVYFDIDPNHTSGDINYGNNHIEIPFSVGTGTPQPPQGQLPNLVIKNVTWNPQNFNPNDTVTFSITVGNTGGAASPLSNLFLEINGNNLGSGTIAALQPGNSDKVNFPGLVSSCPTNVSIKLDPGNSVAESNEKDNEWSQTINCGLSIINPDPLPVYTDIGRPPKRHREPGDPQKPKFTIAGTPNLTISDVDWSPKVFNDNQKITLTYTVKNTGNGDAEPSPSVSVSSGNSTKVNAPGAPGTSVPAGWSKKAAHIWNAKCGDKVTITVDPGNITNESNEADNSWEHTFGPPNCTPTIITELPKENLTNLRISGMNVKKLSTSWNTGTIFNFNKGNIDVDIEVWVQNTSDKTILMTTMWTLKLNETILLTGSLGTFDPGQEKMLGWYGSVNCGTNITFIADSVNTLIESNETDNAKTIKVTNCK